MMTQWHTAMYKVPRSWFGHKVRARVFNAEGKVMINDLDPSVAKAIVFSHNHLIANLKDSESPSDPI